MTKTKKAVSKVNDECDNIRVWDAPCFPPRQLGAGKKELGAELAPHRYPRGSSRVGDWLQTNRIESAGPDWPEGDAADASLARECQSAAATLLFTW